MSAVPYDTNERDWDTNEQEQFAPPGRPHRRFFNRRSAALAAVITCAGGFYAGVRVEKSQLSNTASAATTSAPGATAGGSRAVGSSTPGGPAGGGRFAGGPGGGNASFGKVSSVNGNTIYLTDPTGNTVKVTLSSATKLTKSLGVSKSSLHPGDSVVIQGAKDSNGSLVATSVSDSGTTTGSSATSSPAAG
jgi:uncharacterized protein DUF5666